MSLLAEKTEKNALYELAKCLRFFSSLDSLWVSAEDAYMSRNAENIIQAIIERNGYSATYCKHKGTRLAKIK
jgi:hypothetical protein